MSTINIGNITNVTFKVGGVDCSIYLGSVKLYPQEEPPTPAFDGKYKFTLSDSSIVSAECDATSAITTADTSAYKSTMVQAEIGDCVTSIGWSAFSWCSGLTSVTIPDSVTNIGSESFKRCSSLTSITIGNSVTSIGSNAFQYCSSLTSITVRATTPPTVGTLAFHSTNISVIYVPSESVEAYKTASGWSTYGAHIQAIP